MKLGISAAPVPGHITKDCKGHISCYYSGTSPAPICRKNGFCLGAHGFADEIYYYLETVRELMDGCKYRCFVRPDSTPTMFSAGFTKCFFPWLMRARGGQVRIASHDVSIA